MNELFYNFSNLFEEGGIMMYPLALCSFVSFFVCLNKLRVLRTGVLLDKQALILWSGRIASGKTGEFAGKKVEKTLLNEIMTQIYPRLPLSEKLLNEKIKESFGQIRIKLERQLHYLEISTNISPLIGLLGTALGMLHVFSNLSEENVQINALSSGISEALITTVVGLMIAIPSLIAYSLFLKKIEGILSTLESQINELIFEFREKFTGETK